MIVPLKKVTGQSAVTNQVDSSQKAPSPSCHGVGKGLMTAQGLITSGSIQRLVSHKEYAVEMVHSIIKDTNMDECGKHGIEDLGDFGLFDLVRVSLRRVRLFLFSCIKSFIIVVFCKPW